MNFKYIILFSIKDFNKNNKKEERFPHDGVVINVMINASTLSNYVAVGYEE